MSTNTWRSVCRTLAGLLVPATLSFSTARAAEAIKWADLPKKIGHGKIGFDNREDRESRVVTKAGITYAGRELIFSPNDVRVAASGVGIPRDEVTKIRVRRLRSLGDALLAPVRAVCQGFVTQSGDDWFPDPAEVVIALPIALGVLL